MGWLIDARWTRIWWVRPLSRRTSRRLKRRMRSITTKSVTAGASFVDDRHALAVTGVAADGRVDAPCGLAERAVHQRPVHAAQRAPLQLRRQRAVGRLRLGHHEQAAGVAVEAMDDAGTLLATQL